MQCIKCKREIPDESIYCSYCGRKQVQEQRVKYHKREHGTGTIHHDKRYKRPWVALAPASKYGKGRQYIGCYATRNEARQALDDFARSGKPDLYNATLGDIYKLWSATHYKRVSESAVNLYTSMWKRFERFAEMPMRELRTVHIQELVDEAKSKSAADTVKTLAVMLCKFAVENDIAAKNYAEFARIPKFEKKEKRIFTRDEIAQLWDHSNDPNVQIVLFMIYTGFRIGEVLDLTAASIDLQSGIITGGEKTEAGRDRSVPLPPAIPELKEYVQEWCRNAGEGRLFPVSAGKFRQEVFKPALVAAGIDPAGLTPHSTRHTFASLSAAAGMQPENLQKIIGHAKFSTTAEVYIHQDVTALVDEMRKITK